MKPITVMLDPQQVGRLLGEEAARMHRLHGDFRCQFKFIRTHDGGMAAEVILDDPLPGEPMTPIPAPYFAPKP